jgi:hypothetical protein
MKKSKSSDPRCRDHFAEHAEITKPAGSRSCSLHSRSWIVSLANDQGESEWPFEWRSRSTITKFELFVYTMSGYL